MKYFSLLNSFVNDQILIFLVYAIKPVIFILSQSIALSIIEFLNYLAK